MKRIIAGLWALLAAAACAGAQTADWTDLDAVIEEAVAAGNIPGAVLQIGKPGQVLYKKTYGNRALVPAREAMTEDTIFDCASLTKVVATTTAVMRLFEQGKIRMNEPVTTYLPEFQGGKSQITVRHLLTHFSGMRPDVDLKPAWSGYETGIQKALTDTPIAGPGERFIYSDINFLLLGEIVHRLTGKTLAEYTETEIFRPLGMKDTRFVPPAAWHGRIAPTEVMPGKRLPLRGVVHDPTAQMMGGIAGHAGLFSTAKDLGRFAEMMLNGGEWDGARVAQAVTVRKFTEPQSPADRLVLRGFGWDIDSPFSANRGELFPLGSYGHTGFTGTSLWIDPKSETYVILLTNSVHPHIKPIVSLRARVATVAAAHIGYKQPGLALTGYNETLVGTRRSGNRNGEVLTGLDVLERDKFAILAGKRVGLISNHTGLSRTGKRNVDLMVAAGVGVKALFSPEHGFAGKEDHENIASSKDAATGLPIFSLYEGKTRTPRAEILANLDVLVFDIQDMGSRFYTYSCTLLNAMEAAEKAGITVVVLDRPNPITGVRVEGPILEKQLESFVGCYPLPVRHGMTLGEIAKMVNAERGGRGKVEVVKMEGWQRGDWFDSTGLSWIDPSPNMRSLMAALLYPGIALLEYSDNYSVGRGTMAPFEQVGAPWIRGQELAKFLNSRGIPGIRVYATRFRPESGKLAKQDIEGVRFVVTERDSFSAVSFGVELAGALVKLYPGKLNLKQNEKLIGSKSLIESLLSGTDARVEMQRRDEEVSGFVARRKPYLLY